jgi:hypothetical protein
MQRVRWSAQITNAKTQTPRKIWKLKFLNFGGIFSAEGAHSLSSFTRLRMARRPAAIWDFLGLWVLAFVIFSRDHWRFSKE